MINKNEWCIHQFDAERCDGPFTSKEEALKFAKERYSKGRYDLGHPRYLKAEDYAHCIASEFDERIEEIASDDEWGWADDSLFEYKKNYEDQLTELLVQFCKENMSSKYWTIEVIESF